jgi:2-polyprenyl-6-methoxyphenol hydroxylase-like FAD-dependent oxidoreductase
MSRTTAVVIGGSMAGLLAARVLSSRFARVVIVERGDLPAGPEVRRPAPQAAHAHVLLAGGLQVMAGLFPDLIDGLRAEGAVDFDVGDAAEWHHFGVCKRRKPLGIGALSMTRPVLEAQVRRRVLALANVQALAGHKATALHCQDGRVAGLQVSAEGGERRLDADLVVDASGRGAVTPQLLAPLGLPAIPESQIKIGVGYATRQYQRTVEPRWEGFLITPTPPETRGGILLKVEGGRWLCTLVGCLGDHPPDDEAGFLSYARGLPSSGLHDMIAASRPLGPILLHKFPSSLRRHCERVTLPAGLVVMGDALASFNPIYGQGMTVAALEAALLGDQLDGARDDLAGFTRRFQRRAARIVDVAWAQATGEDLRYPQVQGARPLALRLVNRYVARVHRASGSDDAAVAAFHRVLHVLAPPTVLFAPRVLLAALRKGAPHKQKTLA